MLELVRIIRNFVVWNETYRHISDTLHHLYDCTGGGRKQLYINKL